jgi:hypothetical protein
MVPGVGDLVERTGDGRTGRVLGDRVIKRPGEPQNQGRRFVSGLVSKSLG